MTPKCARDQRLISNLGPEPLGQKINNRPNHLFRSLGLFVPVVDVFISPDLTPIMLFVSHPLRPQTRRCHHSVDQIRINPQPIAPSILTITASLFYLLCLASITSQSTQSNALQSPHPNRISQPYPHRSPQIPLGASQPLTVSSLSASERVSATEDDYLRDRNGKRLVPVVLGVMSKCPDAQICEDVFDKVLAEVSDKTDLLVVYMGDLDPSEPYGVRCKHGEPECRGNIHQLCYRSRFPKLHDWWGFIQCENYAGLARVGDEMLARSCAKVSKHDWDTDVKACADGPEGKKLLRSSVELSHHLKIEKSCSIFINHPLACVHDESWKDCPAGHEVTDFVKLIERQYDLINQPIPPS